MKKEELGELIIASEDMMYHVAKTLLYCDADCAECDPGNDRESIFQTAYIKIGCLCEDMADKDSHQ